MYYKTYCWSIGNTSFRVEDLSFKIEKQLLMLDKLYKNNDDSNWGKDLQIKYYYLMKDEKFIKGNALRKDKDAREVTSGLVNLGVIDKKRKITQVGSEIIKLMKMGSFKDNNFFQIEKDSYIYLKQFLKYEISNKEFNIRPYISLLYFICKLEYLTFDEFTYLLPICKNNEEVIEMVDKIKELRLKKISIDKILYDEILKMENYIMAYDFFITNDFLSEDDFCKIGINRKSKVYDKIFYNIFLLIVNIIENFDLNQDRKEEIAVTIYKYIKKIGNAKVRSIWSNYFGCSILNKSNKKEIIDNILNASIFNFNSIKSVKMEFFKLLHLAKWKSNLEEYYDLNRRYFMLTGILIYNDNKVFLDIIPRYFFNNILDKLMEIKYNNLKIKDFTKFYHENLKLDEINKFFDQKLSKLKEKIKSDFNVYKQEELNKFIFIERLKRFKDLLYKKFTIENVIFILDCIDHNKYDKVLSYRDWDCDVATIFEYVTAIGWYYVSNFEGNILNFIKLSLDTTLFPKRHAAGGQADIIYEYCETEFYEKHDLLIEVTLTESIQQRRVEMEPVSRHLIAHKNKTLNNTDYVIFIAPDLHWSVLSDFRSRKNYYYQTKDGNTNRGLKIIPLSLRDFINILKNRMNYKFLYSQFENAYKNSKVNDIDWYKLEISEKLGLGEPKK
ncbi:MAG: AlwI family type II restriction endonuclease [Clostridiales bacterium]